MSKTFDHISIFLIKRIPYLFLIYHKQVGYNLLSKILVLAHILINPDRKYFAKQAFFNLRKSIKYIQCINKMSKLVLSLRTEIMLETQREKF